MLYNTSTIGLCLLLTVIAVAATVVLACGWLILDGLSTGTWITSRVRQYLASYYSYPEGLHTRREPRKKPLQPELAEIICRKNRLEGEVLNWSATGICLRTTEACLQQESLLRLGVNMMVLSCRIRWSKADSDGSFLTGLQLI